LEGKESAIDIDTFFTIALAAAATSLVAASFVLWAWPRASTRSRRVFHAVSGSFLVLWFAGLSGTLVAEPLSEVQGVPLAPLLLLGGGVGLLAVTLVLRRQRSRDADLTLDSAAVDGLTRVASHRAFQDRLAHECDRAYRFGDTFMLLMLDLDDFHLVNNRLGHRVGDRILLDLATRLRAQLREIDLVARYGGDRFAVILPHTYPKGGLEAAERMRQHVARWVFVGGQAQEIRLTVSVGLCSYPADGATPQELVSAAEKALAFAKAMGGNQVQLWHDTPAVDAQENVVPLTRSSRGAIVRSLAAAVDLRDGYTHQHSRFVSELSAAVARRIGLAASEVARIAVGALLHDVGKIGVPDSILTKEGSLSSEEWACVRKHPVLGKQILEQAPELTDVIPLVLHHQERYDGSGYPQRLRGEDIPLGARIIAAADAYHAIRSNRPYRSGRTHHEAVLELRRCSGTQFDPQVLSTMLWVLEEEEELRYLAPWPAEAAEVASATTSSGAPPLAAPFPWPRA